MFLYLKRLILSQQWTKSTTVSFWAWKLLNVKKSLIHCPNDQQLLGLLDATRAFILLPPLKYRPQYFSALVLFEWAEEDVEYRILLLEKISLLSSETHGVVDLHKQRLRSSEILFYDKLWRVIQNKQKYPEFPSRRCFEILYCSWLESKRQRWNFSRFRLMKLSSTTQLSICIVFLCSSLVDC